LQDGGKDRHVRWDTYVSEIKRRRRYC
jgi:hypothetical protein